MNNGQASRFMLCLQRPFAYTHHSVGICKMGVEVNESNMKQYDVLL
jgi:hypothetical protein